MSITFTPQEQTAAWWSVAQTIEGEAVVNWEGRYAVTYDAWWSWALPDNFCWV